MIPHQAYIHAIFKKHLGPFAEAIEAQSPELYSGIISAITAAETDAPDFLEWFWSDACEYKIYRSGIWQHILDRKKIITTAELHSICITQKQDREKAKDNQGSKANDPRP